MILSFHIQDAVKEHIELRDIAFFGDDFPLYVDDKEIGPDVCSLTIQRHLDLIMVENPIIKNKSLGGDILEIRAAIQQFLYICSPEFGGPGNKKALKKWKRKNKNINFLRCYVAIAEYLEEQFRQSITYSYQFDEKNKELECWYALEHSHFYVRYVVLLTKELGWTEEKIINTPYPKLHQFEREIINQKRLMNNHSDFNASDTYKRKMLEENRKANEDAK